MPSPSTQGFPRDPFSNLFIIFIDDMPDKIHKQVVLYADDASTLVDNFV